MTKQQLIEKIINSDLPDYVLLDLAFRIDEHLNPTSSKCPHCGYTGLLKFSSDNYKLCGNCGDKIEWKLKDKEKRII